MEARSGALTRRIQIVVHGKLVDWEMESTLNGKSHLHSDDDLVEVVSRSVLSVAEAPWNDGSDEGVTRKTLSLESELEVERDGAPYPGASSLYAAGDCLVGEPVLYSRDGDGLVLDDQRSDLASACEPLAEALGSDLDGLELLDALIEGETEAVGEWQAASLWVADLSRLGRPMADQPYGVQLPIESMLWASMEWRIPFEEQTEKTIHGRRYLELMLELAGSGEHDRVDGVGVVQVGLGYTVPGKVETSTKLNAAGECRILWDLNRRRVVSMDLGVCYQVDTKSTAVSDEHGDEVAHEENAVWEYDVTAGFALVD